MSELDLDADLFGDVEVNDALSTSARIQALLDVERGLAESLASLGLLPPAAAAVIGAAARAEHFDVPTLAHEAAAAGNLAIPLIKMLRAHVAQQDASAADWVHVGATSQDIIDTAVVLQLRSAVPLIWRRLDHIAEKARGLAHEHATTVMAGRTWMQQATPVTFGLTAAGWADASARVAQTVRASLDAALVLQLGGATGTLAAFDGHGLRVAAALADRLKLEVPNMPWHGHRDRLASLAAALGVACGTMGKIARDISLLSQTETGEVSLSGGSGGSSTMPHKRNPVGCAVALAASLRAPGLVATILSSMPQELERGLGGWQAEWPVITQLVSVVAGAARAVGDTLDALQVDAKRMTANLALTRGAGMSEAVALALVPALGREAAHHTVATASRRALSEGRDLIDVLIEQPDVARVAERQLLQRLLDPRGYIGESEQLIARVIQGAPGLRG
jgi:3-carboxy-cis,cis-muconate cycloisomerase